MQPVDIYGQMTTLWAGYSSDLPYAPMLRDCEKGEEAEQQRLPVEYGSSSHQEGSQGIVGCTPTNVPLWEIPI